MSVTAADMASGYAIRPNAASKAGRGFQSASKHSIPCVGELDVPMQSPEGHSTRQKWQVAPEGKVARPLLSIGEECDRGNIVVFSKTGGAIMGQNNGAMRKFPRLPSGAYEIEMWLPPIELVQAVSAPGGMWRGM